MAAPTLTQAGHAQLRHAVAWAVQRGATLDAVDVAFMSHIPAAVERVLAYERFAEQVHRNHA